MEANVREKQVVKKDQKQVSISGEFFNQLASGTEVPRLCLIRRADQFSPVIAGPFIEVQIRVTVIAITTGKCIGKTNGALVVTVHMHQLNKMAAEKALLHELKIRTNLNTSGIRSRNVLKHHR